MCRGATSVLKWVGRKEKTKNEVVIKLYFQLDVS